MQLHEQRRVHTMTCTEGKFHIYIVKVSRFLFVNSNEKGTWKKLKFKILQF